MIMIREVRKEAGLTMKQLGAIIGVSESAVSQYESGKRQADYDILKKMSHALDCSIDYLLTGEETRPISIPSTIYEPCSGLYAKLKSMREGHGLSPKTVALQIGISEDDYLRAESGEDLGCAVLVRLVQFFRCEISYLLPIDGFFGEALASIENLTSQEHELICKFRQLNTEGQNALLVQLNFFLDQDIYKNVSENNSVQKNA